MKQLFNTRVWPLLMNLELLAPVLKLPLCEEGNNPKLVTLAFRAFLKTMHHENR